MALKLKNYSYAAHRDDDITHFMKTAGEAGGVVCYANTAPFTNDPNDPDNVVAYVASPTTSSMPAGVLMNTVLDYDPTKVERNCQNPFEVVKNSKVWVVRTGYVDTDMVTPADLAGITGPVDAYLGANGLLTTDDASPSLKVGRIESAPDADGYVKFRVNIT